MKHETKRLSFKMDEYDEEEGIFSGYGAVFENVDSGGDIIEPGAFAKALAAGWERVKILALHNDCWLPIGKPLELREDEKGLFLKAKISDTSMGKDIKILLKDGVLNELSIGYEPVVFEFDQAGIRHLKEVDLWEVSVVTWAMNPEAVITDYKSATEEIRRELKEGRKISDARLKSLKQVSQSMKDSARMIDSVIEEADGKKSVSRRRTPGSRKSREIEIVF
ncbi:HK97 family phage prohead protease [Clostridium sp. OF09-36]|uniref:HK97 family phage prohead protease n=1 Tax=Clostridium sp. OF09-36 TaxID=2292310 RepID=UPI000E491C55|nr:HK97 family phage prohead protease [Clostridium sp. OF09-36]RHV86244.1 HK97 family phage prohead protease [Clostridium sp. OF09-36]